MKKIIFTGFLSLVLVLPVFAQFPDDFEDLDASDWTVWTGSGSVSISLNHTSGGMASFWVQASGIGNPGDVGKNQTVGNGETWVSEAWVYRSSGSVYFGWYDGPQQQITSSGSWTYVADTYTFPSAGAKEVNFYVSGLVGSNAYLDDVNTFEIIVEPTLAPDIDDIPDLKMFKTTQTLNNAFDLEDFNTSSAGTTHATVDNPLGKASLAGSVVSQASHNVATTINQSFSVTNTVGGLTTGQKVKYSTYKIKKLPKIGLNPGDSIVIDMLDYMIDSTGPVIPKNYYSYDGFGIVHTWDPTTTQMTVSAYSYFTAGYSYSPASVMVAISPDTTTDADLEVDTDREKLMVYANLLPQSTFSTANDTTGWSVEDAPGKATRVQPSWAGGAITYTFADNQGGAKVTPVISNWINYTAGQWYTARARVNSDDPSKNHQFLLFNFSNPVISHVDVAANVHFGLSSTPIWIETPLYSNSTGTGYPQYQVKAGAAGSITIDEIQIINAAPTLIDASRGNIRYKFTAGDFNTAGDIALWGPAGYDTLQGPTPQPGTSVASGVMSVDFSGASPGGTNQRGLKWTASTTGGFAGIVTPTSTPERHVGVKAEITKVSGSFTSLGDVVLLAAFGTVSNGGSTFVNGCDLIASAEFGNPITDGTHYAVAPGRTGYHQFQFGLKKDSAGILNVDNIDYLIDNDDPNYGDGSLFQY